MPLTAGLSTLQGEFFTDQPVIMAGATMAALPMIVLFVVLQRQFIQGIALPGPSSAPAGSHVMVSSSGTTSNRS
jgi:ABC-type maltose transport system permease subunit